MAQEEEERTGDTKKEEENVTNAPKGYTVDGIVGHVGKGIASVHHTLGGLHAS